MIRIKDYIFNENEIEFIEKIENGLIVCPKAVNVNVKEIKNATFEDIEWNYENNNEYCNVFYEDRIKELEKENKILKELNVCVGCENNPDYKSRINKAIDYIENKEINYATFNSKDLLDTGVGYDLWEILKGEKNE